MSLAIGIDVGGTTIKAALVDTDTGLLRSDRLSCATEQPATPTSIRDSVIRLVAHLAHDSDVPVGVAVPGVVRGGALQTAANLDRSWIGADLNEALGGACRPVSAFLNDADAAALAESKFGAARGVRGLAVMVTLGTGVGVGLVHNGCLIPNAELGHLEVDGDIAERFASARARTALALSWSEWAAGVSKYLQALERLLWPEIFVIAGGPTESPERWFSELCAKTPVALARFAKDAGIVGAALVAAPELAPAG